jgi:hypothetical protein
MKMEFENVKENDPILNILQLGFKCEQSWESFFKKIVEDRSHAPPWDALSSNDDERARWVVHQLFRKLPSPGRIYRFWRTAEEFFDALETDFKQLSAMHPNRWRTRRLQFGVQSDEGLIRLETYLGHYNDAPFELICYGETRNKLLTICNLARVFKDCESSDDLKGKRLNVQDDDGKGHVIAVSDVTPAEGPLGVYNPVIVLEKSPLRFRILVPLESVTRCIEHAIEAWRQEFARVFDRMPLAVGVVGFSRLTPLQAVLEAARNLEDRLSDSNCQSWQVCDKRSDNSVVALEFKRPDGGREWVKVPVKLPDGRDNLYYGYVRVKSAGAKFPHDFELPKGEAKNQANESGLDEDFVFRRFNDLEQMDEVYVNPSRFAAVFLDSTARRFDSIEPRPLTEFLRVREVWSLLRRVTPSVTALHDIWTALESCRRRWQTPDGAWLANAEQEWREFARALLGARLKARGEELNDLVAAAGEGTLQFALEWHLRWLKEPIAG